MLFNKGKYIKKSCKKLLHKVGKRWIVLSIAVLGLLGGSVMVSQKPRVNADTTSVETQASNFHNQLLNNATTNSSNPSQNSFNNNASGNNSNDPWQYSDENSEYSYSNNNGDVSDNGSLSKESDSSNQNNSNNQQYYFNSDNQENTNKSDYGLTTNGNNVNYSDNNGNVSYTSTNPSDNNGFTSSDNGENVHNQIISDINNAMNSDANYWNNWSDGLNSDSITNSDYSDQDYDSDIDPMYNGINSDYYPMSDWSDGISDGLDSDAISDCFPSDNSISDFYYPSDFSDNFNNSIDFPSDSVSDNQDYSDNNLNAQSDNVSDNQTTSDVNSDNLSQDAQEMKSETLNDINNDRAFYGLAPLTEDSNLDQIANLRAQQIQSDFNHCNAKGQSYLLQDAKKLGISTTGEWAENIAEASLGAADMDGDPNIYYNQNGNDMADMDDDAMMNYDQDENNGHRENILNPNLTKVGISVTYNSNTGAFYLAEDFDNK